MKFISILPFVGLGAAFIVPNEQIFSELAIEDHRQSQESSSSSPSVQASVVEHARNALDEALADVTDLTKSVSTKIHETAFDAQAWLDSAADEVSEFFDEKPPHRGPPHRGPPHHGRPDHDRPHHPPHHHKPNLTVYELIAQSKYTTKLAELINDYPDLVDALNGTKANYTVFAPTDKAFERIPEHAPKPSKEDLKKILSYHVSPEFYPAGRVLATHTIPTLLKGKHLPGKDAVQRLSVKIGLNGLSLNFYSRVVAIDIVSGVIVTSIFCGKTN